jgi:hypothetical protein
MTAGLAPIRPDVRAPYARAGALLAFLLTFALLVPSASVAATCGNGILESGEDCDPGLDVRGDCCTSDCHFVPGGQVCRDSQGACDLPDTCSGTSAVCSDAKSTDICRPAVDVCDVPERCDGFHNECPADGFAAATLTCRPAVGDCDAAERCTGNGPSCPADAKKREGAVCRAGLFPCDVAETCDGVSDQCPDNVFKPEGTPCREAADVCDVPEVCTGTSALCPPDAKAGTDTICRPQDGDCDVAEFCDGRNAACPADVFAATDLVCRPAVGDCDAEETCTGRSATCPEDRKRANGAICRLALGGCDVTEKCDGVSDVCPADVLAPQGEVCRPATGVCDVQEVCSGSSKFCPGDQFVANGTPCPDNLFCNGAETCQRGQCVPPSVPPCVGGSCDEELGICLVCGDGAVTAGEECGEPGLPACSAGSVCLNCECVPEGPQLAIDPACGILGGTLTVPVMLHTNEQQVSSVGFTLEFPIDTLSIGNLLFDVRCATPVSDLGFACGSNLAGDMLQVAVTPPVGTPVPTLPDGPIVTIRFQVNSTADPGVYPTCTLDECMPLAIVRADFGDPAGSNILTGTVADGCVDVLACIRGDCNGNDRVTTADVTCDIQRIFDTREQTSPCEDCNGDGRLTTADVTCIILCLFGSCPL